MAVIGILSLALLPISLEMACELIQDAEVSAAILWDGYVLFGISLLRLLIDSIVSSVPTCSRLSLFKVSVST